MSSHQAAVAASGPPGIQYRLPLVDGLRALAATVIAWHHFALYPPLADWAMSIAAGPIDWLRDYARATQVFFVVSGFVLARSLTPHEWDLKRLGRFAVQRYIRLSIPYLGAIALALAACAFGRGWLPNDVVGDPATLPQVLSHVVFLQFILGYDSLSAGLWFVCISMQLALIYVAMLFLRDARARLWAHPVGDESTAVPMVVGWALAAVSLFYFNLHDRFDPWAVYFFGHFFLGVMVHHGLRNRGSQRMFVLYILLMAVAMAYVWRWRLATAMATGLVLFFGGKLGFMESWPRGQMVRYLGRTSYSLFLIHFPVLVFMATIWVRQEWISSWDGLTGLLAAYVGSLAVADVFYHRVERPAMRLSRRFAPS